MSDSEQTMATDSSSDLGFDDAMDDQGTYPLPAGALSHPVSEDC